MSGISALLKYLSDGSSEIRWLLNSLSLQFHASVGRVSQQIAQLHSRDVMFFADKFYIMRQKVPLYQGRRYVFGSAIVDKSKRVFDLFVSLGETWLNRYVTCQVLSTQPRHVTLNKTSHAIVIRIEMPYAVGIEVLSLIYRNSHCQIRRLFH